MALQGMNDVQADDLDFYETPERHVIMVQGLPVIRLEPLARRYEAIAQHEDGYKRAKHLSRARAIRDFLASA